MKVASVLDEAYFGEQAVRIDQLRKLDVVKVELSADAHHVAVEAFLDESAKRADAKLAPKHHVERMRGCAPRLVAELDVAYLLAPTGSLLVPRLHPVTNHLGQVERAQPYVPVLVARHASKGVFRYQGMRSR